jgi:PAS domain S-box-containing protein
MTFGFLSFSSLSPVWLHVVPSVLIALACFFVAAVLLWSAHRRRDPVFSWTALLFGAFLVACGCGFLLRTEGGLRGIGRAEAAVEVIAAVLCVPAAIFVAWAAPRVLKLPGIRQWARASALIEDEIHERRATELGLRVSEASYRRLAELLDLTQDAIFVRSLEGKINYWNLAAERLYGWQSNEVLGRESNDILKAEFPKPLSELDAEVLKGGSWEGELVHHHRDGAKIIVSSRWVLRRNAAGTPEAILESNRDITQRVREEKKFREFLESAPDAMVIVDRDGHIQLVNAQAEKLFAYAREELIGQAVEILMPQRFRNSHVKYRAGYSQSPRTRAMGVGLEPRGLRKDGTEFPIEINLSPLETAEGMLVSSTIRDVTERHLAEERIQKLNTELQQKVAEISAVNNELETFSYSVSHDLRAPLRHIDGFARILLEEHAQELSKDGLHDLDRIVSAVNHMGHLVDDLLNLARIGRKEMARQRVDLDELVRQVLAELPQEERTREIEWRIEPLPPVDGDAGLLKLAFFNLLSNAAKFTRTRQPAVIEVGTSGSPEAPVIFVRDNGVGFDPQYADKLFGVFQRLHRQEDFEGTGIGLATVQRIIHRHGGEIWVEAALDRGATFFLTLKPAPDSNALGGATEEKVGWSHGY